MAQARNHFSKLNALFINTTLKKSPKTSNTEGLWQICKNILQANDVSVEEIRFVDHQITFGIYPDMTEQG